MKTTVEVGWQQYHPVQPSTDITAALAAGIAFGVIVILSVAADADGNSSFSKNRLATTVTKWYWSGTAKSTAQLPPLTGTPAAITAMRPVRSNSETST